MNELAPIQRKIYEIRGQKVILDRDLAALYQVETRVLNQAVKRNIERFPEDFMFQLTKEEFENWKSQFVASNEDFLRSQNVILELDENMSSQFVTTSQDTHNMSSQFVTTSPQKRPKSALPYAFTEHGVVMLASLLRSEIAVTMSVQITRAFVAMRRTIAALASTESKIELLNERVEKLNMYIEDILRDQNEINEETSMQLELINQSLAELQAKPKEKPRKRIGFNAKDDEWI